MPGSGAQKDLTTIRKIIEKDGYKVVPSGSGHWKIVDPKGQKVIDEHGPVILSGTTSEIRGRDMAVHRLMAANILKRDPWAPTPKREGERETDEMSDAEREAYEREMELERLANQQRADRSRAVLERLEPVVSRLGGWDKRGMLNEVGQVALYYASRLDFDPRWSSVAGAAENADALRKGATLSEAMARIWEGLLDELEDWPDTQLRWVQLLREAKGIEPPTIGEGKMSRSSPTLRVVTPTTGAVAVPGPVPTLALRAAFEMGVGRSSDSPDRAAVMAIVYEIAELEVRGRSDQREAPMEEEGNDDDGES